MNSILGVTVSGIALAISLSTQAATVNSRIITDSTGSQLTQQALFLYNSQDEDDKKTAYIMANKALDYLSTDYVAARLLGNMYYHGIGVKVDKEEALAKYIYAADNDAVSASMTTTCKSAMLCTAFNAGLGPGGKSAIIINPG